jgi:hypothetical protein
MSLIQLVTPASVHTWSHSHTRVDVHTWSHIRSNLQVWRGGYSFCTSHGAHAVLHMVLTCRCGAEDAHAQIAAALWDSASDSDAESALRQLAASKLLEWEEAAKGGAKAGMVCLRSEHTCIWSTYEVHAAQLRKHCIPCLKAG